MRKNSKQEMGARQEWLLSRIFELEAERNAALERENAAIKRAEKAELENKRLGVTLSAIRSIINFDESADNEDAASGVKESEEKDLWDSEFIKENNLLGEIGKADSSYFNDDESDDGIIPTDELLALDDIY